MTPLALFLTSLMVGFSGAASPGPVSTFCLSEGARSGFWAGPRITLGHGLVEFAMVLLLALGLGPILTQGGVTAAIAIVGGVVLLWMGVELTRGAWTGNLKLNFEIPEQGPRARRLNSISAGALISLSNPYWFVWWATVGTTYIAIALGFGLPGLLAFYAGHILADLSWNSLLTFLASTGRRVLPLFFYRWLFFIFGIFLLGFSLYFLLTGIKLLTG